VQAGDDDSRSEAEARAYRTASYVMEFHRIRVRFCSQIEIPAFVFALLLVVFWLITTVGQGLSGGFSSLIMAALLLLLALAARRTRSLGQSIMSYFPTGDAEPELGIWSRWLARAVLCWACLYVVWAIYCICRIPLKVEQLCEGDGIEDEKCSIRSYVGGLIAAALISLILSLPVVLLSVVGPAALIHRGVERVQTRVEAMMAQLDPSTTDLQRTDSGRIEGKEVDAWVPHVVKVYDLLIAKITVCLRAIGLAITPGRVAGAAGALLILVMGIFGWPLFILFTPMAVIICGCVCGCAALGCCDDGQGVRVVCALTTLAVHQLGAEGRKDEGPYCCAPRGLQARVVMGYGMGEW